MELDFVALVEKLGLPVTLIVYYCVKDWRFTQQIVTVMAEIKEILREKEAE